MARAVSSPSRRGERDCLAVLPLARSPARASALARTTSGSRGSGGRASCQGRSRRTLGRWIRIRSTVSHLLGQPPISGARWRVAPARGVSAVDAASLAPCPQPKKRQLANALFGQAEQSCGRGYFIRSAASLWGYRQDMELRQLEAFVAVATELHFGRAAERLHIAAPTLSELIRRLERELGTPLFTRTTRQVAITSAGAELLTRSKVILDEVAAAKAAVRRVTDGEAGTVRLGITPPPPPAGAPPPLQL